MLSYAMKFLDRKKVHEAITYKNEIGDVQCRIYMH